MLNNEGFDLWTDTYDESVRMSEEADQYPFAGYKKLLNTIYSRIRTGEGRRVLDIGFGTATLSSRLYTDGYAITGLDFSREMISCAKVKMPEAVLFQADFSKGLPAELENRKFDWILCTYAIHHLTDIQKAELIRQCQHLLAENGCIMIGDVAFKTAELRETCRKQNSDRWDNDEIYPVADVLLPSFSGMTYEQISHCAGIFTLKCHSCK